MSVIPCNAGPAIAPVGTSMEIKYIKGALVGAQSVNSPDEVLQIVISGGLVYYDARVGRLIL